MGSRVPSAIRWKGNKDKEELLDDPVAESLFGLFLKVKDSPRHIAFKPERLINEVYYMCNRFYQEKEPSVMMDDFSHEIETDMGWRYAPELVFPMAYVVLKSLKSIPAKMKRMLMAIEKTFGGGIYWSECQHLLTEHPSAKSEFFFFGKDLSKLKGKTPIFIINKVEQLNAVLGKNASILK